MNFTMNKVGENFIRETRVAGTYNPELWAYRFFGKSTSVWPRPLHGQGDLASSLLLRAVHVLLAPQSQSMSGTTSGCNARSPRPLYGAGELPRARLVPLRGAGSEHIH